MDNEIETLPTPPKRRKIKLTKADKQAIVDQRQLEHAVSLFLDLEQNRTTQQIADEVGMSLASLKRLTQTPEFMDLYDKTLLSISHHPRMQALQSGLMDLVPMSYTALKRLLSPGTAHTAQVQAVKLLWDTVGVAEQVGPGNGEELGAYLKNAGVQVDNMTVNVNIPIPEEYRAAFERLAGVDKDIIDGVVSNPDTDPSSSSATPQLPEGPVSELPDGSAETDASE